MPGPAHRWDLPEDPRDQTVDLPRIDVTGNGASGAPRSPRRSGSNPYGAGADLPGELTNGNGHGPSVTGRTGRSDPGARDRIDVNAPLEPLPRMEPREWIEPRSRAEPSGPAEWSAFHETRNGGGRRAPDAGGDPYALPGQATRSSLFEPAPESRRPPAQAAEAEGGDAEPRPAEKPARQSAAAGTALPRVEVTGTGGKGSAASPTPALADADGAAAGQADEGQPGPAEPATRQSDTEQQEATDPGPAPAPAARLAVAIAPVTDGADVAGRTPQRVPEWTVDGARRRAAAGSLADLRSRLDRLPDGHPSSPYEDGGTARPQPHRLSQLELGLPAPEREPSDLISRLDLSFESASSAAPAADSAVAETADAAPAPIKPAPEQDPFGAEHAPNGRAWAAGGDGSDHAHPGKPDSSKAAENSELVDRIIVASRAAEGRNSFGEYGQSGLTPAIRRVAAQLDHGGLAPGSEAQTLKSRRRLAAKLARLVARHPDRTAAELAASIGDTVRYAFAFEAGSYTEGTWLVHRKLKAQGFELEARRNRWDSPEYKGVWTRWRDPAHDLAFEVQFHTFASWVVVQQTHEAYVAITDPATPAGERARLRGRQVSAAAGAKPPHDWAAIADFGQEIR